MTAQEWVVEYGERLRVSAPDQATFELLLEVAAVAAHASERIAAPIACYLVGRAEQEPVVALEMGRSIAGT